MAITVRMHGLDDVQKRLKQLGSDKIAKRMARKAARQAMNIVRDAARDNAKAIDDPETSEKIWKNIATQGGKTRNRSEIKMRVGVRGGASFSNKNPPKTSGGDTRHWRWIEYGKTGVPAVPFMRPALSSNINPVIERFAQVFNAELDRELGAL